MAGFIPDSASQSWLTPPWLLDSVREAFGVPQIGLDPCSNTKSLVRAAREFRLPETDGLREAWDEKTIFVNPPYGTTRMHRESLAILPNAAWKGLSEAERKLYVVSDVGSWLRKCALAARLHGSRVAALVPCTPETRGWRESVWPRANAICFFGSRLRFIDFESGKAAKQVIPKPMVMIFWNNYGHTDRFERVFEKHGAVVPCGEALASLRRAA